MTLIIHDERLVRAHELYRAGEDEAANVLSEEVIEEARGRIANLSARVYDAEEIVQGTETEKKSKRQLYKELILLYREADAILKRVREIKKMMREVK